MILISGSWDTLPCVVYICSLLHAWSRMYWMMGQRSVSSVLSVQWQQLHSSYPSRKYIFDRKHAFSSSLGMELICIRAAMAVRRGAKKILQCVKSFLKVFQTLHPNLRQYNVGQSIIKSDLVANLHTVFFPRVQNCKSFLFYINYICIIEIVDIEK